MSVYSVREASIDDAGAGHGADAVDAAVLDEVGVLRVGEPVLDVEHAEQVRLVAGRRLPDAARRLDPRVGAHDVADGGTCAAASSPMPSGSATTIQGP